MFISGLIEMLLDVSTSANELFDFVDWNNYPLIISENFQKIADCGGSRLFIT
jgi:hypothetical protein